MIQTLELPLFGEAFLRLFYPSYCGACSSPLEIQERNVCGSCFTQLSALKFTPQNRLAEKPENSLDEIWSLYPYEGIAKKLIGEVKFSSKRWLLSAFTADIQETAFMLHSLNAYDYVVSIPLERSKRIQREFHLVQILAQAAAKTCDIPYLENVLIKKHPTLSQNELTREERLVNLHGAFKAKSDSRIEGARLLLMDDVYTTGATTHEAALVLKNAGARSVDLLTLARTEIKK